MVTLALATAWFGGDLFAFFWAVAGAAIVLEWQYMVGGSRALLRGGIGLVALAGAAQLTLFGMLYSAAGCLAAGAIAVGLAADRPRHVWSGAGVIYAGAMVVSVTLLRRSWPLGFETVIWLYTVVWMNDIMAYFGGRLLDGPKLWPRVSPAKTWAGTIVGALGGALAGAVVAVSTINPPPSAFAVQFFLGLLCAIAALAGDLFESALKRRFGLKDTSRLIPGHGGVMDRLDGFVTASLFAAIIGVSRYGFGSAGVGVFYW